MSAAVVIVDYGSGNLLSVARAFERCGISTSLSSNPDEIENAKRLVLPGVGAFGNGMMGLQERDLVAPIKRYAASNRPLLGICLGMQLLASSSEEFGFHEGMNIIPGKVVSLPGTTVDGAPQKIPSIGWADLNRPGSSDWRHTVLEELEPDRAAVYLVHSFEFLPDDAADQLATYRYGGRVVCAAISRGKVFGCQFHPEKSGPVGLKIISTFSAIS